MLPSHAFDFKKMMAGLKYISPAFEIDWLADAAEF